MKTFKNYFLNNFQLSNTVLLTIATMLYIASSEFLHLISRSLYHLTNISPFCLIILIVCLAFFFFKNKTLRQIASRYRILCDCCLSLKSIHFFRLSCLSPGYIFSCLLPAVLSASVIASCGGHRSWSPTVISCACVLSCFSHVWPFATLWTVACQATLSLGILQARILERGVTPALQGIFLVQGSDSLSLVSPALAGEFFTTSATWEAHQYCTFGHLWRSAFPMP